LQEACALVSIAADIGDRQSAMTGLAALHALASRLRPRAQVVFAQQRVIAEELESLRFALSALDGSLRAYRVQRALAVAAVRRPAAAFRPPPVSVRAVPATGAARFDQAGPGGNLVERMEAALAQMARPVTATGIGRAAVVASLGAAALVAPLSVQGLRDSTRQLVAQGGAAPLREAQRAESVPAPAEASGQANGTQERAVTESVAAPAATPVDQTVVVRAGDTLSAISKRVYGDENRAADLASANALSNPNLLRAGLVLKVPLRPDSSAAPASPAATSGPPSGGADAPSAARRPIAGYVRPVDGVTVRGGEFGAPRDWMGYTWHTGLDLAAPQGTNVVAAAPGRVVHAGPEDDYYGNSVIIDHGGDVKTRYAHLSAWKVTAGAVVAQGQPIAAVGSTGNSFGPHLHFEVIRDGEYLDPSKVLP
jgi:murein DD-endopeptidase MepM/ murein hydrolase activator NlpD